MPNKPYDNQLIFGAIWAIEAISHSSSEYEWQFLSGQRQSLLFKKRGRSSHPALWSNQV